MSNQGHQRNRELPVQEEMKKHDLFNEKKEKAEEAIVAVYIRKEKSFFCT